METFEQFCANNGSLEVGTTDKSMMSRRALAVKLAYLRKTGYKYVDMNIPTSYQPACSIEERIEFIRKNRHVPIKGHFTSLTWSDALNAWVFTGDLKGYSYAWYFIIYDRSVVDYIVEQLKTLPKEWQEIEINI